MTAVTANINESNTKCDDDFIDIIVIRSDIHIFIYIFFHFSRSTNRRLKFSYRQPPLITKKKMIWIQIECMFAIRVQCSMIMIF